MLGKLVPMDTDLTVMFEVFFFFFFFPNPETPLLRQVCLCPHFDLDRNHLKIWKDLWISDLPSPSCHWVRFSG